MAITVLEKHRGVAGDATSARVLYIVHGTDGDAGSTSDEDAFDAVMSAAPTTRRGLPLIGIDVEEELVDDTIWQVSANYGANSGDSIIYPQASVDYEFSFQAPAEHIYQSLETRSVSSIDGEEDPEFFGGAINVQSDNGDVTVDGIDLPAGTTTNAWVFKPLSTTITDAYQVGVEAIMGNVNSFTFKNRAAGTMRFVSCDGGAQFTSGTTPKWQIRFGFDFKPHRSNFTVGGITVPFKGGHDLIWSYFEDKLKDDAVADNNKIIIKTPKLVIVERVFFESNFNVLGI